MMFNLGPFSVASDGTLSPHAPDQPPVVRYTWRGVACAAELTGAGLRLTSLTGRIPSTADRRGGRDAVVAGLPGLREQLPPGAWLDLLPDHQLQLRLDHSATPSRIGAIALVTEMVRFALALDPYLDRLAEAGVTLPSGSAKTCPG